MNDTDELLSIARRAAGQGAALLKSTEYKEVRSKGDRDFVTDLDIAVQVAVRQSLLASTPDMGFLGEEEVAAPEPTSTDGRRMWVLDPIDGTSNFIHGLPLCGVSLALIQDGAPILGVVVAPFLGLEYVARRGHGALVNERQIASSSTNRLDRAIVSIGDYAVGADAPAKNRRRIALTTALAEQVERIRMFGSAALDLVWLAEGRTDGCVLLSNKPWDTAAGVLIAREAGAIITDSDGTPHTLGSAHTIAAVPAIHRQLVDLVKASGGR